MRPNSLTKFRFLSLTCLFSFVALSPARAEDGYRVVGNQGLTVVVNAQGDLDGDALPDVGVGVPDESGAFLKSGAVYLFYGKNLDEDLTLNLDDADDVIEGDGKNARAGTGVAFLPDEDGDGLDEFSIGLGDGSSETVFSTELGGAATETSAGGPLYGSTTVGVSVGLARNVDCALNPHAARAGSSSTVVSAVALALLLGLFLLRRATTRR